MKSSTTSGTRRMQLGVFSQEYVQTARALVAAVPTGRATTKSMATDHRASEELAPGSQISGSILGGAAMTLALSDYSPKVHQLVCT